MALNIVLIEPEIPNNTGNIGRLALGTGSHLHLVKPFGFEIDDNRLKRAGLDYWQHLSVTIYDNKEEFFKNHKGEKMAFLSSHATKSYTEIDFSDEMFIIFGKESKGLSSEILEQYPSIQYKIPMFSEHIRSLNLANAVAIVIYEGLRSIKQI